MCSRASHKIWKFAAGPDAPHLLIANMTVTEADYVICGGGIAGLTLAARLAVKLPSASIIVIEPGVDPTTNPDTHTFAGYRNLQPSAQAYTLNVQPNKYLNNRADIVAVGKAVGGSSAINGGAWTRGPASDYNLWAKIVGDDNWSYEKLLPSFRLTEHDHGSNRNETQHGYEGPLDIYPINHSHPSRHYPLRDPLKQAFAQANVPYNPDPNIGNPKGLCEMLEVWQRGTRPFPSKFYNLSRVTILTEQKAHRITFDTSATTPRATGVTLSSGTHITAKHEVIVAAGVYHTPQLLMLSGIGPKSTLEQHGIDIILANPSVGAHLRDHIGVGTTWRLRHPDKGLAVGHPDFMSHPDFFSGMIGDFVNFDRLPKSCDEDLERLNPDPRDREVVCREDATHYENVIIYTPFGKKHSGVEVPFDGSYVTSLSVALTTTGRGSVGIGSGKWADPPVISSGLGGSESDFYVLRRAMRKVAEALMETEMGREVFVEEVTPEGFEACEKDTPDSKLDERIRALGISLDHPMGSCRMAKVAGYEDEETGGVVDSKCKMFGVDGLRIVDASVIPVPIAAHIQAAVYALAERAAEMIAQDGTA